MRIFLRLMKFLVALKVGNFFFFHSSHLEEHIFILLKSTRKWKYCFFLCFGRFSSDRSCIIFSYHILNYCGPSVVSRSSLFLYFRPWTVSVCFQLTFILAHVFIFYHESHRLKSNQWIHFCYKVCKLPFLAFTQYFSHEVFFYRFFFRFLLLSNFKKWEQFRDLFVEYLMCKTLKNYLRSSYIISVDKFYGFLYWSRKILHEIYFFVFTADTSCCESVYQMRDFFHYKNKKSFFHQVRCNFVANIARKRVMQCFTFSWNIPLWNTPQHQVGSEGSTFLVTLQFSLILSPFFISLNL